MFGFRFVKAQPTTYLMKYRAGAVTREGAGLSTLYYAPVTSLVAVPIGSRDAAFMSVFFSYDSEAPEKLPQRILSAVEVLAQQTVKQLTLKEALQASDQI